jgi:hypothetical protein
LATRCAGARARLEKRRNDEPRTNPQPHKKTPLQASVLLDKTLEILSKHPLQENADSKVEDARGGLSTAELTPSIILSESFAGH